MTCSNSEIKLLEGITKDLLCEFASNNFKLFMQSEMNQIKEKQTYFGKVITVVHIVNIDALNSANSCKTIEDMNCIIREEKIICRFLPINYGTLVVMSAIGMADLALEELSSPKMTFIFEVNVTFSDGKTTHIIKMPTMYDQHTAQLQPIDNSDRNIALARSDTISDIVTNECRRCEKSIAYNIRRCGYCKVAAYCNKECQAADYPDHKKVCKKEAELLRKIKSITVVSYQNQTADNK